MFQLLGLGLVQFRIMLRKGIPTPPWRSDDGTVRPPSWSFPLDLTLVGLAVTSITDHRPTIVVIIGHLVAEKGKVLLSKKWEEQGLKLSYFKSKSFY